jgi:hypothetical protein
MQPLVGEACATGYTSMVVPAAPYASLGHSRVVTPDRLCGNEPRIDSWRQA